MGEGSEHFGIAGAIVDIPGDADRRGLTRRQMIRSAAAAGVAAWTAPVIIGSIASPAAAATLPPYVPQFNAGSNDWVVDQVRYPGCSNSPNHPDLQLIFNVGSCTHVAHSDSAVEDGIHINPCQTNQVQFTYEIGSDPIVTKLVNVSPTGVVTVTP